RPPMSSLSPYTTLFRSHEGAPLSPRTGGARMWKYIATRAVHSVLVVIAASMIVFALSHLTGDPTPLMLPADATPEMIARYRTLMGFDRPVHVQYWSFIKGVLTGNFGRSFMQGEDALQLVLARLPASLKLTLVSL